MKNTTLFVVPKCTRRGRPLFGTESKNEQMCQYNDNFEFNSCGKFPENDIIEIYEPLLDAKYRLDPNRVGNLVWIRNSFCFEHNGAIYSEYELHNILNGIKNN